MAYTYDNRPVFARDLQAEGAMAALLRDAIQPNLVQDAGKHGLPSCTAVLRQHCARLQLRARHEAGPEARRLLHHGSGLRAPTFGAEKFLDIKCRLAGLAPDCIVVVATVRALKYNGGVAKAILPPRMWRPWSAAL